MKRIITMLIILFTSAVHAELSCSANGTKLFYINGVNVSAVSDNQKSADLINAAIKDKKNKIDKGSIVESTDGIYNYSTGLLDDSRKLREQLILDADGNVTSEKRRKHFEELIKSDFNLNEAFAWESLSGEEQKEVGTKIKSTLDYIYNNKDKDSLKYDDGNFSKTELYADLLKIHKGIADLIAVAASDFQVVQEVKKKIKEAIFEKNKKVIFVSHSQGNEALRTSYLELKNELNGDGEKIAKLDSIFGTLQVAAPSPEFIGTKFRGIKLDTDLIISASGLMTTNNIPVSPNYIFMSNETPGVTKSFLDYLLSPLMALFSTNAFHGFDDVYMSSEIYARPMTAGGATSNMKEIFTSNMIDLANDLGSNCNYPKIKTTTSMAPPHDASGIYNYPGQSGTSFTMTLSDIAVDEDDSVALSKGYDHSKTVFTWKVMVSYPQGMSNDLYTSYEGEGKEISIDLPYRDFRYGVLITAKSEEEEVTVAGRSIKVLGNRAPSIALEGTTCDEEDISHFYSSMSYKVRVSDDDYAYDNQIIEKLISTNVRKDTYNFWDGTQASNIITVQNSCLNTFTYDLYAQCQNGALCYDYGLPAELQDPECVETRKTGLQWTYLQLKDAENNKIGNLIFVSEGVSGQPNKLITDPTDPDQQAKISIPVGGACSRGSGPVYDMIKI